MSKMKKLGIIGIGNWGKNLIRDASKISYVKKCSSQGNPKNINWLKTYKSSPTLAQWCRAPPPLWGGGGKLPHSQRVWGAESPPFSEGLGEGKLKQLPPQDGGDV